MFRYKYLGPTALILALTFAGCHSWAQSVTCSETFSYEGIVRSEAQIIEELQGLNDRAFEPHLWQTLAEQTSVNKVYLIPVARVRAVVKFGEAIHFLEPLAYQVGLRLGIDVPVTVPVRMGGQLGMAQHFREGTMTFLEAFPLAGLTVPPLPMRFFDFLLLNGDRNAGNQLVPHNNLNSRRQTAIDHEHIFNRNRPEVQAMLRQGTNHFLLENIPRLREDYPDIYARFRDPELQNQVIGLVQNTPLLTRADLEHVEAFFRAFNSIDRLNLPVSNPQ